MYKGNFIGKNAESKAFPTKNVVNAPLPKDKHGRTCLNPINHPDLEENTVKCIEKLIKTDKNVLNSLFILKSNYLLSGEKFKHLAPSQKKIGKMAGVGRKAVNESIERLFSLGLIGKLYRHKRPCLYTLNGLLLDPELKPQLTKSLPALSYIPHSTMLIALIALSWNGDGKSLPHGFFNGGLHNIYIRNKELSNSREIYKKQAKSSRQLTAYLPEADNVSNAIPNFFYKKEAGRTAFYQDAAIVANDSLPLRQSRGFGSQYSNQLTPCQMLPVSMARLILKDINKKRIKTDEERIMEATIPSYVESIYSLDLTVAGKVHLSAYPQEIIELADSRTSAANGLTKPFDYFKKIAQSECATRGIEFDMSIIPRLYAKYNLGIAEPLLKSSEVRKRPALKESPKNSQKKGYSGPSNSATQEAIRKQIAARKAYEAEQEGHNRSGLEEFAQMVEQGLVEWQNEGHKRFGTMVVERYRANQKSNTPFENPLFHTFDKASPTTYKNDSIFNGVKSLLMGHVTTSQSKESFDTVEISFLPEDQVVVDRDEWSKPMVTQHEIAMLEAMDKKYNYGPVSEMHEGNGEIPNFNEIFGNH